MSAETGEAPAALRFADRVDPLSYELGRINERVKRIEFDRIGGGEDSSLTDFYVGFVCALIIVWIIANRRRDEAAELDPLGEES